MPYYTVRRDDAELRVVICPKCRKPNVIKYDDVIPYRVDSYLLRLMQCNNCKTYFTFYREDGVKEIPEDIAKNGLEKGRSDMAKNGQDVHGHSFYIIFKNKPQTISADKYDELMGFKQDKNSNYCDQDVQFKRWLDRIPSVNQLVRYRKMVENIDFESMKYLENYEVEGFE